MHEIGLLACYAQLASFIPRVRVDQSLLTPALEWRMISRYCRKMVPNPLKHLLALLDPRQSRWVDGRNCQNIFLRKLVVSSHVPFSSQRKFHTYVASLTRSDDQDISKLYLCALRLCDGFQVLEFD
jgi:hypothetical protein